MTLAVPAAYQNDSTTEIVDYTYAQTGTTLAWCGWSGQYAAPGASEYIQNTAITRFTNRSRVDGLDVPRRLLALSGQPLPQGARMLHASSNTNGAREPLGRQTRASLTTTGRGSPARRAAAPLRARSV